VYVWEENVAALRQSVRAGTSVTLLLCAGVAVYFIATFDEPNRVTLLVIDAFAALTAGLASLLPLEAMARRRLIVPFFLGWSAVLIAIVAGAVAVEDDPSSPFVVFFFLPMVFAAMAYPLRLVIAVSVLDVAACILSLTLTLDYSAPDTFLFTIALLGSMALCVLQARAQEQHLAEVARLSRTDHLTGCLNRRGFEDELSERMARYRRYGTPLGLVLLDLDGFKAVNDLQGHAAGDDLLRRVAGSIDEAVRATDATSRVGGDEFAVLLEQSDGISAPCVSERIVEAIALHSPVTAGWASCPDDAVDADGLYRHADARLYERKRDGAVARG
jgi:diguanylate cyclase (GGDEF)-like protein